MLLLPARHLNLVGLTEMAAESRRSHQGQRHKWLDSVKVGVTILRNVCSNREERSSDPTMKSSSSLIRFGVSLEKELLSRFDAFVKEKKYPTRSEAIRALIKEKLVRKEWASGREVAGAIVLVYDHGRREILNKIVHVQHEFHENVISTQHVHLDHDNCLEVVVVKGKPRDVDAVYKGLQSVKGIKHISLDTGTTGRGIP